VRRLEGDETVVSSEQRRKQLAREKFERQRKRREAARRKARIRNAGIALGVVLVLVAGGAYAATGGLNGDEKKDKADSKKPSKAPDPCDKPAKGTPNGKQWKKEPAMKVDKSASYSMDLDTTCGRIGISMDAGKAPHTVNSFNFLAGEKFFDHTPCHRLVDDARTHVLQCGDPQGTGQGGPGYTIPDENLKDPKIKGKKYPAGTVAMANQYTAETGKGRDSGGSQFFLVFEDSKLPPDYTPFGRITEGEDVLKKIAKAGSTPDPQTRNTPPNATVVIDKATARKS
jgi:peptidyl-prolyl cis-trans isomerase B (cyclophilin B)